MNMPEIPAPMTIASYSATRSNPSGSAIVNESGMLFLPGFPAPLCTAPPVVSSAKTERRSFPQHRRDLIEGADAGVHLHRLVEAVGVRRRIAAPAAFAHDDRGDIPIERFAYARLDAA